MDKETAKNIDKTLRDAFRSVEDAIRLVQARCSVEEFEFFRTEAGRVAGGITLLLLPLWEDYPDIAPEGVVVSPPKRGKSKR
ncbi:hypothetical protein SAMN05446635_8445 [Burkholderia sp. OK233]|nr:hypothetical protein SAMN05446635_8445 [Burkholderia sp. OK233]